MRKSLLIVAAVVAAACSGAPQATASASPAAATASAAATVRIGSFDRPVAMAFLPTPDIARATASAKAIAGALEKATALKWDVRIPQSYSAAIEDLCAERLDIAWLSPLASVQASTKNCGEPLLAALRPSGGRSDVSYSGQIVVRSDTAFASLKDLKGKRMAFGDRLSLAGTLFPMLQIKKDTGEDPTTFFAQSVYIAGDEKPIVAVYQGQVDAGASPIDSRDLLEASFPDVKQRTKRIATVGPIPNDGLSVRRGLPADLKDRIQRALLEYGRSDDGKRALKALYGIDGLDKADAKLYDGVLEAARLAKLDLDRELAATPRPSPTPTRAP